MILGPLHGHGPTLDGLWGAARRGRLPHAITLEGVRGTGRFLAAKRFSAGLLCADGPADPCGGCGPCVRMASGGERGNHPDFLVVDPLDPASGGKTQAIPVARIARRAGESESKDSVEVFLGLRPLEGGWRIVLIREAQRMNASAQNALLKMLEEPTPGTLLILETHRPDLLLDTVLSRCARLVCPALSPAEAAQVLTEQGMVEADANVLARWCGGSPGDALALHRRDGLALGGILAQLIAGQSSALEAGRRIAASEGLFEGETPTARSRDRARTALDLAIAMGRDLLRAGAGVDPDGLCHGEFLATLGDGGRALRAHRLSSGMDGLLRSRRDIEANMNPDASLERGLLALAGSAP